MKTPKKNKPGPRPVVIIWTTVGTYKVEEEGGLYYPQKPDNREGLALHDLEKMALMFDAAYKIEKERADRTAKENLFEDHR